MTSAQFIDASILQIGSLLHLYPESQSLLDEHSTLSIPVAAVVVVVLQTVPNSSTPNTNPPQNVCPSPILPDHVPSDQNYLFIYMSP